MPGQCCLLKPQVPSHEAVCIELLRAESQVVKRGFVQPCSRGATAQACVASPTLDLNPIWRYVNGDSRVGAERRRSPQADQRVGEGVGGRVAEDGARVGGGGGGRAVKVVQVALEAVRLVPEVRALQGRQRVI